jgi:RNA polymerase sigma-70 factor (ECF subfamily)
VATRPDPTEFERTTLPFLTDCYAFAVSLSGNVPDAEDLVQETYLKAQRAFDAFTPGTNAKAWLFTILRRVHIDRHRRARIRPITAPDEELEGMAVAPSPDESDLPDGITPDRVRGALERVPEAFRLAVRLRDLDGFSYAEIGRVLDIPPGTVMSRIHRGRESLRRLLVGSSEDAAADGAPRRPADAGRPDLPGTAPLAPRGTP